MKKKVLFITGAGHCGSTLITLMLGSHADFRALGELNSYPHHYQNSLPLCEVCQGKCIFWDQQFSPLESQQLSAVLGNTRITPYIPLKVDKTIRNILGNDKILNPFSIIFSKCSQTWLIDSSKNVEWIKERLEAKEFTEGLIDAYILHMIRDGRAVMSSYLRRFKSITATKFTEDWKNKTLKKQELVNSFPPDKRISVRYEELATKPEEILQKICNFLQISYSSDMVKYWNHDHHIISGNSGVRSLIWQARQEEVTAEVRKYHGDYYETQGLSIKLDLRWKNELSSEQVNEFNRIAGDINQPYEWNE